MRKLIVLLAIAGLMLLAVPAAQAFVPVAPADLTGPTAVRYVGDGHTIGSGSYNGLVNNGFLISWNITPDSLEPGEYEYNYSISGGTPGNLKTLSASLKDLYFTVSPNFAIAEPSETTPANPTIGNTTAGNEAIHALYWTTLADGTLTVHFDSHNIPVWGSFFADDGSTFVSGNSTYANNGDFPHFMTGANTLDYIPVPDTVPVPPAVWLFGSGLIGLVGLRRKLGK